MLTSATEPGYDSARLMAAASVETTHAALPAALFLALLAAVSLAVLLVPSWRQRFHWGRTRDSYPVSRRGCGGIAAAFAVMACGPAGAYAGLWSGRAGFFVLVAGFAIFIGAGLLDRPASGFRKQRGAETEFGSDLREFAERGDSPMNVVDKAVQTQLSNIQKRTGKSLDELFAMIRKSGAARHGEIRDMLKQNLGLGHGDANTLAHTFFKATAEPPPAGGSGDVLDEIYAGGKASLRPIHDAVMVAISGLGAFEIAPKKGYVSLRRKKQFAMVGPATKTRVEVGLNMKDVEGTARLLALPPGGMCQYKVHLSDAREVDDELISWIRRAYDSAG